VLAQIGEPVLIIADNAFAEERERLLPGSGPHRVMARPGIRWPGWYPAVGCDGVG
jgi:hypothetical protein